MRPCPSCGGDCGYTKKKGCQYQSEESEWVGLTEDEIHECFEECCNLKVVDPKGGVRGSVNIFDVGREIEAKLKERNT